MRKQHTESLRRMGAQSLLAALADAAIEIPDMLIVANMLADELDGQKHLGPLIATEAGLPGIEALQVRAAMATGAAAIRMAYLALKSGEVRTVAIAGLERMSSGDPTPIMARALDAETEIPAGQTMVSINAHIMEKYLMTYNAEYEQFANFAVNAHRNALSNPDALLHKQVNVADVLKAREIVTPIRLYDCAPICDGSASIVLTNDATLARKQNGIQLLASETVCDSLAVAARAQPLELNAARQSAQKAYRRAGIEPTDVDFFELHDAFSIMACLALEACGFAEPGAGWKLAAEGDIFLEGKIPIATFGGLKARGHPIGATGIYQAIEIYRQLRGQAGMNQISNARCAMMQSIGGAGTTLITNIFHTL
ncbi:MAG: hypothetical protein KDK27_17810 [Leptospiraceae bacterium]|nr:hypothetical protein [Leptospiraceae bacterium]